MNNWHSGLFDCFDDCALCCYGCWCTSCLYGENAVQIDGSDYDEACWAYCSSGRDLIAAMNIVENRTDLRIKYGLVEEPCDDCTVIFCCAPCAVCQAARELKFRKNMPATLTLVEPTGNAFYAQHVPTTEPVFVIQPQQR